MKKFVFTLESLLAARKTQEDGVRKDLALIDRRLSEERFVLECLAGEMTEMRTLWSTQMAAGVSPLSLGQFDHCFNRIREQQQEQRKAIQKTEAERAACQERLRQAMTEVKALSNLRDQQYEEYKIESGREMENEIGEWVTGRHGAAVGLGG
ncbi:MAG: flagellar export protein FliJ [Clostridia bacterium]|nr:flagellar export protein FliJ [Clostridia bacterium]